MIYLGSDHGGFDLKEKIKKWLTRWEYTWEDVGNTYYDSEDDYPQFAFRLAQKVVLDEQNGKRAKGILCCRSAAGMVIAANKVVGARAAVSNSVRSVEHNRRHNDVNILALSGDWLEEYQAKKVIKAFLTTEFSGEERHVRRLKQIEDYEKKR